MWLISMGMFKGMLGGFECGWVDLWCGCVMCCIIFVVSINCGFMSWA